MAIDIKRNALDYIVQNAVISSYKEELGMSHSQWKEQVHSYVNDWVLKIEDITGYVKELYEKRNAGVDITVLLPQKKYIPFLANKYPLC